VSTRGKTRLDFFAPPGDMLEGYMPSFIRACLVAVGHEIDQVGIGNWTLPERLLAYDYAMRVRLHVEARAQNCTSPVELRPCPSFVLALDAQRGASCFWTHLVNERSDLAS
jgi:hypothetical protein